MENRKNYRGNSYNHDNLARKQNLEQERRAPRKKIVIKANEEAQVVSRINSGIDLGSVIVLSLAIVCMFAFGIQYLVLSSKIMEEKSVVSAKQSEYSSLKSENDSAYNAIDASVDIGYVYETAVGELGMVFPSDEQIVEFDYVESGYVRQYQSISE